MTRIPTRLKDDWVVAVNEYPMNGRTGHINLTFVDHLIDRGTYGQNIEGWDSKHHFHPHGRKAFRMPGGVFLEPNDHAIQHFVIVSLENFYSMLVYAQSRAQLTATMHTTCSFVINNCSDFAFQVFANSNLTAEQKDVSRYVRNKFEWVAAYNEIEANYFLYANYITDTRKTLDDTRKTLDKVLHR